MQLLSGCMGTLVARQLQGLNKWLLGLSWNPEKLVNWRLWDVLGCMDVNTHIIVVLAHLKSGLNLRVECLCC